MNPLSDARNLVTLGSDAEDATKRAESRPSGPKISLAREAKQVQSPSVAYRVPIRCTAQSPQVCRARITHHMVCDHSKLLIVLLSLVFLTGAQ
jgi:hypothetical protein